MNNKQLSKSIKNLLKENEEFPVDDPQAVEQVVEAFHGLYITDVAETCDELAEEYEYSSDFDTTKMVMLLRQLAKEARRIYKSEEFQDLM